MSFNEQPFTTRFVAMGDEAEDVFERVWRYGFVRYGIRRPPIKVSILPPKIKHTPDYLTSHWLVEVQGFGSDNILKFKIDKLNALKEWDTEHPVLVFLYHKTTKTYACITLWELDDLLLAFGEHKEFNDGNRYIALHRKHIEKWVDVE